MSLEDWAADGNPVTSGYKDYDNFDDAFKEYRRRLDELLGIYGKARRPYQGDINHNNPFDQAYQQTFKSAPDVVYQNPIKDPATRKAEIEAELEIIRGRVPTPRGYTVNPLRVKELMAELKTLG